MKKYKIIYIHQRPYPYNQSFYKLDSDFYYYFGEGALYDQFKPNDLKDYFEIEIWRGEVGLKKIKSKYVKGTLCKIFPAFHIHRIGTISLSLLKELSRQRKNSNLLIHYTATPHIYEFYLIATIFGKDTPIFVSHQGGPNPLYKLKKQFRLGTYFSLKIEKFIEKYVDMYFSGSLHEINYFKEFTSSEKIYDKPHWGVNLNNYIPHDKTEARKKVNLPLEKKIILLFGKLNKYRGIQKAVHVRDKLKKDFDVMLLNIGSDETCPDYQFAKENKVELRGYVEFDKVSYYFSAGDVYLYLTEGEENFYFAGTGIAPLEALACNTPIVTNTLHNFPFIDWSKYGVYARNIDEAVEGVRYIFNNPEKFSNTRRLIEEYFDWNIITGNIFELYLKFFNKYYK